MDMQTALEQIVSGHNLSQADTAAVFELIMSGQATPAQIGAFLAAIRVKGETAEELAGAASTMRALSTRVEVNHPHLVDTCGTGGSGSKLFNISTAAAFVAAAAGAKVAKHGNRKMTSFCGSADVLEAAGVTLELTPEQIATCITEVGVGFMFAPAHHSAMRFAGPVRQEIGIRTIFNILGPLSNPAGAEHGVLGVYDESLVHHIAEAASELGAKHLFVVHGLDGLDEISLTGPTLVGEVREGFFKIYEISPEEVGLTRCEPDELKGAGPEENAGIIKLILEGVPGPCRDIVVLNAAAAITAGGLADSIKHAVPLAQQSIDEGHAADKLAGLVRLTSAG